MRVDLRDGVLLRQDRTTGQLRRPSGPRTASAGVSHAAPVTVATDPSDSNLPSAEPGTEADAALISSDGRINRPHARPKLLWLNLTLTLTVMALLVEGTVEPAVLFFAAVAIALILFVRDGWR